MEEITATVLAVMGGRSLSSFLAALSRAGELQLEWGVGRICWLCSIS
jgi:hypothetical protein